MCKGILKSFCYWKKNSRFFLLNSLLFCLDKIRNILENIGKCDKAIKLDVEISKSIVENIVDKTSFISTEDSLLNLAASDIVDSIFYSNILKFDIEDSSICINWFLEYSAFTCYNQACFISLIKARMNVNVISYEIYNEFDVTRKKERDGLRYKGRWNGELTYSPSFPRKLCTTVSSAEPRVYLGIPFTCVTVNLD